MISFENPSLFEVFLGMLLAAVAIFVAGFLKTAVLVKAIRVLLLAVLGLLVFSPSWNSTIENEDVVLVDISESMDVRLRQGLILKAQALAPHARIIEFADGILTKDNRGEFKKNRTNIESALSGVQGQTVERNIVLVSDGFQNKSSVFDVLPKLKTNNTKLFPLVDSSYVTQVGKCEIKEFEAPLTAPSQSAVDIRVIIGNDTAKECKGKLEVKQDTKLLFSEDVALAEGARKSISTKSDPTLDGKRKLTATFNPIADNTVASEQSRFLTTSKREKILLLNGTSLDARIISPLLRQQSFQIDEYFADQQVPSTLQYQEYASIIINNAALKTFPADFPQQIHDYVQKGGTLLVLGGERSYGLGGYRDSALEKALPVFSLPPQTEQKRLNAAVQLVLDKSKSMEQQSRLDFVKAAAKEVINSLKNDDYLGLVAFDNEPFVVIPINRLDQIRQDALSRVNQFYPSGSTRLLKALQLAGRSLERVPAGRKHIIILTDGRLPDAGPMYVELVKQLRITGVTVSSVLISDEDGSYPLKEMAEVGGGVFYVTNDPSTLPRIFLQDIRVSTGERTVKESVQYDIKRGPAGIQSTRVQSFPRLKGFVLTKAKEDALVELMVAESAAPAEPLLVSWNYGKGRSIAFTSDLYGRWSDEWMRWGSLSQFMVDLITRKDGSSTQKSAIDFDVRTRLEGSKLTVELLVYTELDSEQVEGMLDETPLSLQRSAKGRYTGQINIEQLKDSYDLHFSVNQSKLPTITFSLGDGTLNEKSGQGINLPLLSQIASSTGGSINPEALPVSQSKKTTKTPLEPFLYPLLLLILLLEVLFRERRIKAWFWNFGAPR